MGLELTLVVVLQHGGIYAWEVELTQFLQRTPAKEAIFVAANFLTNTLSIPFLVLFMSIVGTVWVVGRHLDAVLLLITFPLHVLVQFPKALVDRPRPSEAFPSIEGVGGMLSFPSGHAEFVVSFYGFLTYLIVLNLDRRWQKVVAVVAWMLLAVATGLGRIATGRHWPIDIFSSYVFGIGLLSGLIWLRYAFGHALTSNEKWAERVEASTTNENS